MSESSPFTSQSQVPDNHFDIIEAADELDRSMNEFLESDLSDAIAFNITESGNMTLHITDEGRELAKEISSKFAEPDEGIAYLTALRNRAPDSDTSHHKATKKVLNSAIGKLRYKSEKNSVESYLSAQGLLDENINLNAVDIRVLSNHVKNSKLNEVYSYLIDRSEAMSTRTANKLGLERNQVTEVVKEMYRFLGPEFGAELVDPTEKLSELVDGVKLSSMSCVNLDLENTGSKPAMKVNARGRRVADQILHELMIDSSYNNFSDELGAQFAIDLCNERIEMLRSSPTPENTAMVRVLQSVIGKARYRQRIDDYETESPYPPIYSPAKARKPVLKALATESVTEPEANVNEVTVQLERVTIQDIQTISDELGLVPSDVSAVVAEIPKRHSRFKTFRRRLAVAFASLMILATSVGAAFAFNSPDQAKELVKEGFYAVNERLGDDSCEALAAYVDDSGDYSALPGIVGSWIDRGKSCRDVAPPGFVFLEEETVDDIDLDFDFSSGSTSSDAVELSASEMQTDDVHENFQEQDTDTSIVQNIAYFNSDNTVATLNQEFLGQDISYAQGENDSVIEFELEAPAEEQVVDLFVPRSDSIELNQEELEVIASISSYQEAIEYLYTLTPDKLSVTVETNEQTGVDYVYYSLPEEIVGNDFIATALGMNMENFLGQSLPEGVVAMSTYYPSDSTAVFTPGLWKGDYDYTDAFYGSDGGSWIKAAGGEDRVISDFVIEWAWEDNSLEPFRPTNRIGEVTGSSFEAGAIASNAVFLCLNEETGEWWITDWDNVPKDNENVDAANLLWSWTGEDGQLNLDPTVNEAHLRNLMTSKLNDYLSVDGIQGHLPGVGNVFRTVTDGTENHTNVIFHSTFLSTLTPRLFGSIVQNSPIEDADGNLVNISEDMSIVAASPDQNYSSYGNLPVGNDVRDISGSNDVVNWDDVQGRNNIVGFSITN